MCMSEKSLSFFLFPFPVPNSQVQQVYFFTNIHSLIFSHFISTCSLSLLSFLHLLLSFDLITSFSPCNRFTYLLSPCSLSPSLSLSFPLYFHLWALSLHPLSPSSPPILICSSLWRKGVRKREFLTSKLLAVCWGRASEEPGCAHCGI